MANNFKIVMQRTGGNLHLNLAGDFDGSSALELLNMLKENLGNTVRITIDTGNLKQIHPFGRQVFNHKFSRFKHHPICVDFTGRNADRII
jgi:hypothetical protein